jgi:peroxiredoxin
MHYKYASKGVAFLTVSVDPVDDKELVLKFLKKQEAVFTNLLFDEPPKVWQAQFEVFGPPATLVFDRAGKLAVRFDNKDRPEPYTPADVEKAVLKLLGS